MKRWVLTVAAAAILVGLAGPASAATFKWANDADSNSMDPYARQETFLLSFDSNMYEPLVRRDKTLKLEAALLDADRSDHLALQAAPGRQVP